MFFKKNYINSKEAEKYIIVINDKAYSLDKLVEMYNDAEFESKHKRDKDGKFSRMGGGGSGKKDLKHIPIKVSRCCPAW